MKKSYLLLGVIAAVLLLGIAYASMANITLQVTGNATAVPNADNFQVKFTGTPSFTGDGKADLEVTGNTSATMEVYELDTAGESTVVTFEISNLSEDLTANLSATATNSNEEYFTITPALGAASIAPKTGKTTLTVTVTCIKTPVKTQKATTTISVVASPDN